MSEANTVRVAGVPADVPFSEFRAGLPFGRFRVIVNPALAQKYMRHRLFVVGISLVMLVLGVIAGFSGYTGIGLTLAIGGVALGRIIKAFAPKILLYLASNDPAVYRDAIDHEIMEVRFAR